LRRKRVTDSVLGIAAMMVVSLKLSRYFEVADLSIEDLRFVRNRSVAASAVLYATAKMRLFGE
jgi:hypothetical protein